MAQSSVYGHHHPEHLRGAAHALGYRRSQSLAITLAPGRRPRLPDRQPVGNIGGTRTSNQTLMSEPRDRKKRVNPDEFEDD
jgi:hypothetical protein